MTLIDGDRIVTAQLYDDEHEEFIEKKMSIIDYVNAYTDEGVTTADDVLKKLIYEIAQEVEREEIARSVYRGENGEKKDAVKAEQCTGSIFAYRNVIRYIENTWLNGAIHNVDYALDGAIKELKAREWIPVSERLPEDKTYVLTTIKVPNRIAHTRSGWYAGGFFYNDNGDVWKATDMEVIAWMPSPEPYEPQESEDGE